MTDMDELHTLSAALRDLVAWDVEDDLPGYRLPERQWAPPRADTRSGRATPAPSRPAPSQRPQPGRPQPGRPEPARAQSRQAPPPEPPAPPVPSGPPATQQEKPSLEAIRYELGDCRRCKLCDQGRRNIVFGEGNPNADLLFAGEGPGFHEDRIGRPFVGKAGELLDRMIEAMTLKREDVYICNVVKCRPPRNRDPESDEIIACQPFLHAQLRSIRPKVVVALGRFAAQTLLNTSDGINRLRGEFRPYMDAKLMATYHPAYLLRHPEDKRKTWEDLQKVMTELGLKR